jgi:DNA-binding NarL/FixJ family response regulator/DNA-binding winged helix-turn-helix (wHTH) protein
MHGLEGEHWMTATAPRNVNSPFASPQQHAVRLLLVGREDEFEGVAARRILDGSRPWAVSKSTSLLGALELLQATEIDLVLLSHAFRDEEIDLLISDARRNGFEGLIVRAATGSKATGSRSQVLSPHLGVNQMDLMGQMHPASIAEKARSKSGYGIRPILLTSKQREVLDQVSKGMTNPQIAKQLRCSEGGVKATLQELFRKLEVRKRSQLVRVALERGLIDNCPEPTPLEVDATAKEPLHVGDFVIDVAMHQVWVRGVEAHLTPSEFQLLWVFATQPGKLVTGGSLCSMFWRNPTARQTGLRVLIGGLRAKIELTRNPRYIVTERFLGYRFIPSPAPAEDGQLD